MIKTQEEVWEQKEGDDGSRQLVHGVHDASISRMSQRWVLYQGKP